MATKEAFISLPLIHRDQGSALSQADLDADSDSLKRTLPHNSEIERYLESTWVHLTGRVLKWDDGCTTDAFGKDSGRSLSHLDMSAHNIKQTAAVRGNGVRSEAEHDYLSIPATEYTTDEPRTWIGGIEPPATLRTTWPRSHERSDLPESSKERDKLNRTDPFGRIHRENLDFITRQAKQAHKLAYDNMAAKETLRKAQDVIRELRAKINRRNTHIQDRRNKEGNLVELVESLRRARDEKLQEYKSLVKGMNEALKEKEQLLDQMGMEQAKAEMFYQRQLTENTELLRKIELREKAIKTLREKTGKVKKWKDEARS